MRIAVGADHAGYALKLEVMDMLWAQGHDVVDVGPHELDPLDDYPDFAKLVATQVASKQSERGVMVCGSGVGASVAINKVRGVRGAVCHDTYSAHQGVEHDDMNVLCLGARIVGSELATEVVKAFVVARFIDEEKYRRRLNKVLEIEARTASKQA